MRRRGTARASWIAAAGGWTVVLLLALIWHGPPVASVEGRVVNPDGTPAWGVRVLARGYAGPADGHVWFVATDRAGHYEVQVRPGRLEVEAIVYDLATPSQSVDLLDGGVATVDLILPREHEWDSPERLELFAPEPVYRTSETPSIGLTGATVGSSVRVTIDRLDLARLVVERGGGAWFGAMGWSLATTDLKDLAPYLTRVQEFTVPVLGRDVDGRFTQYLELPVHEPGCYVAGVNVGDRGERLGFQVTDLGLVTKVDPKKLLVYACDLTSGDPLAGVSVELWGRHTEGRVPAVNTDAQGLAVLDPSASRDDALVVYARHGSHEALTSVWHRRGSDDDRTTYLYTDRPIYRPGQRVYLKGIVRDRGSEGWVVPPAQPVKVEIYDGRWQEVVEQRTVTNDMGSFAIAFDIPEESFTGDFEVQVSVNGRETSGWFPVKAYVKPEYSVQAHGPTDPVGRDGVVSIDVRASYFFGSPVSGGEVRYRARRHSTWWSPAPIETDQESDEEFFEPWLEGLYRIDDEGGRSEGEEVRVGAVWLDDGGHVRLDLPATTLIPPPPPARGTGPDGQVLLPAETSAWGIDVELTVLDGSGRREETVASAIVLPADIDLQARCATGWVTADQDAVLRTTVTDPRGRPIGQQPVMIETWRTYDVLDCIEGEQWVRPIVPPGEYPGCTAVHCTYGHRRREIRRPGPTTTVTTDPQGRAEWAVRLPQPGRWVFVATALDAQDRPVVRLAECYVSTDRGVVPGWHYEAKLELLTDRERYQLGDTARLRVQSQDDGGHVLVTHEGHEIREPQVVAPVDHVAFATCRLGEADLPTTWAAAVKVKDKQLQQAGVALPVDIRPKLLEVEVTADTPEARPGDAVTFTVITRRAGQPVDAEVSLAVVDESIYAMRHDNPEQLVLSFYGRRWNRVATYFSAEKSYYLGGKDADGEVRREFPDTALWEPMLRTGERGTVSVSLTLPDNITTWRATAVAHTKDTELGFAKTALLVRKPLMVRLETPRFLTRGDRATLSAVIHNETARDAKVDVVLEAPTLRVNGLPDWHGPIAAGARRRIDWTVDVPTARTARVRVSAAADGHSDIVERELPITPFAESRVVTERGELTSPAPASVVLEVPEETLMEGAKLRITAAPSVAGAVIEAIDGLVGYPYGCTEQTASRFLGCLAAAKAYERLGWRPESWTKADELNTIVRDCTLRLRRMQHWDGGWGWWERDDESEAMTAYALHALLSAREAGHEVAQSVIENGLNRLERMVRAKPDHHATRALALWVLARAGRPVSGQRLAALVDTKLGYDAAGMAIVAMTARRLKLAGLERRALDCAWTALPHERPEQASVADLARSIQALLAAEGPSERVHGLVEALYRRYENGRWSCTIDTCAAVEALAAVLAATGEQPTRGALSVLVNDTVLEAFEFTDQTARSRGAVYEVTAPTLRTGANTVTLSFAGTGKIRYAVTATAPVKADTMTARPSGRGMTVERRYDRVVRGRDGRFRYLPVTGPVAIDDIIRVTLVVRAPHDETYLLVEDPLPAGCEVCDRGEVRDRFGGSADEAWCARDVRDDRVAFFITSLSGGRTTTLTYLMRAAAAGRYRVGASRVEPMYEPEESCAGADDRLEIR